MDSKTEIQKIEPFGKRLALEELRRALDKCFDAADALDEKLQALLGFASIIVSLYSSVQVVIPQQKVSIGYCITIGTVASLYVIMFLTITRGINPKTYTNPISSEWNELGQRFFDEEEGTALDRVISDYLAALEKNHSITDMKARAVKITMRLLFMTVIILLLVLLQSLLWSALSLPPLP